MLGPLLAPQVLRLEDDTVFIEGCVQGATEQVAQAGKLGLLARPPGVVVVHGVVVARRHRLTGPGIDQQLAVRRAFGVRTGREHSEMHDPVAWHRVLNIHTDIERGAGRKEMRNRPGRRHRVHPSQRIQPPRSDLESRLHLAVLAVAAYRMFMHPGDMAQVREVFDLAAVVRLDVHLRGSYVPVRVARPDRETDQPSIGLGRIAHPDPYPVVLFDDREAAHAGVGRNHGLARDLFTATRAVEFQSVVQAAQRVAFLATERQRGLAVRTAIFEGDHPAVRFAIKHDTLTGDLARDDRRPALVNFIVPACAVPGVLQKNFRHVHALESSLHRYHHRRSRRAPAVVKAPARDPMLERSRRAITLQKGRCVMARGALRLSSGGGGRA